MNKIYFVFLFLVTYSSSFAQTVEDKNPMLTDRFLARGALFVPFRAIQVGVNGNIDSEITEDIDFDESFGLDGTQVTLNLDFMWRFSKSKLWSVRGQYFSVGGDKENTLEGDIEWEEVTYRAGARVKAGYGLKLYRIFFGRVISTGQKHELGGGLGIHGLSTDAFIEGEAFINDASAGFRREGVSAFLPLPNLGIWYFWAPNTKWAFSAEVDWFGIKIGEYSGGLLNVSPGVTFQPFNTIGFSVKFHYINYYANVDQKNWNGSFDMLYRGPSIGFNANF